MLYYVWKAHKNQAELPGERAVREQGEFEGDDVAIKLENLSL